MFEDLGLYSAEFADYLNMVIINGRHEYTLTECTGATDRIGAWIYEEDILDYQGGRYRVYFESPQFLLEHISGTFTPFINVSEAYIVGNTFLNSDMMKEDEKTPSDSSLHSPSDTGAEGSESMGESSHDSSQTTDLNANTHPEAHPNSYNSEPYVVAN